MILDKLSDKTVWYEFAAYKQAGGHLSAFMQKDLAAFIENEEYLPVVEIIRTGARFPLPAMRKISKKGSTKKRTVFLFSRAENYVLKLIAYLLGKYDFLFPDNLYSFKRNVSVKTAVGRLTAHPRMGRMYSYKVDIHDYFHSVDTEGMVVLLEAAIRDDPPLLAFLSALLREPECCADGQVIRARKGIMAGVPVSGFLANLCLAEMDEWFATRGIPYARYSDDIILFADTEAQIEAYEAVVKGFLRERQLTVNPQKEARTRPGEPWEFLGFCFTGDAVDLSPVALRKIKDKIRRKSHALVRWKNKKGAEPAHAVRAFIKHFNRKFYRNDHENELTWCRWYFPTITTDTSLKIIDEYMVENIRFIATGKHTKANYNLRYEEIKRLGYRSLVHEYYRYRKDGFLHEEEE